MSTSNSTEVLQEFYDVTLRALQEAKNDRLWFKTNLKLCSLYHKTKDFEVNEEGKELHRSCKRQDGTDDVTEERERRSTRSRFRDTDRRRIRSSRSCTTRPSPSRVPSLTLEERGRDERHAETTASKTFAILSPSLPPSVVVLAPQPGVWREDAHVRAVLRVSGHGLLRGLHTHTHTHTAFGFSASSTSCWPTC